MDDIKIRQIAVDDVYYSQIYDLREEVLRKPIGLSLKNEDLSGDADDIILGAILDNKVVGCLMIHPTDAVHKVKIRQMAVADEWQGKGLGRMLMTEAEQHSWRNNKTHIILHARVTAQPFYDKLGYHTTSDVFTEVGIPHVVMEKMKP
ncbi:MAG: GNAT family N-acetyltransferase [Sphingobacteriales bacterium]|nr:MAG: GNAT family N-acetyltransferase [Sphingobacteriales bacterium]